MGRREKTSAEKIRDGAGAESSSLSGESAYTHQGAKDGAVGGVGGSNGVYGLTLRPQVRLVVLLDGLLAA